MAGFRRRAVRVVFAAAIVAVAARVEAADWQFRPFLGFTFAGDTTFVDFDHAIGQHHATFGVTAAWIGEVVGVDVDLAHMPGFFQTGEPGALVISSGVTTLTGNVVVAVPHRLTEYVLRPYIVGGAGVMRVSEQDYLSALPISVARPAIDFGAGAVGFITKQVGLAWEVRRFQSVGAEQQTGLSIGGEKLSFWRATRAVAIRY